MRFSMFTSRSDADERLRTTISLGCDLYSVPNELSTLRDIRGATVATGNDNWRARAEYVQFALRLTPGDFDPICTGRANTVTVALPLRKGPDNHIAPTILPESFDNMKTFWDPHRLCGFRCC